MADDKSDTGQPQFEGQSQAYTRVTNNNFDSIELGWDSCDFKPTTATKSELRSYFIIAISERIYKAIIREYNQYLVPQVPIENIEEFSGKVNRQSYENDIDTKFDRTIPKPSQKPISTSISDSKVHNIELSSDF
ncbi:hypothetical protein GcM3_216052, partial [Golovinomyces cichoracearum]